MQKEVFSAYMRDLDAGLLFEEPLKDHCSFRIGGPAEALVIPKNEKALIAAIRFARENGERLTVLGNGSNVLVSDDGVRGIVVKLAGGLTDLIYLGEGVIAAGAGVSLTRLCLFALEKDLSGLEFAYGIPGSVGGAVYMNAGAYGGEIKNALMSVRVVSLADGGVREIPAYGLDMRYRHTPFMDKKDVITAAYFRLTPGDKERIGGEMRELLQRRKASQPLEYPSAGSTFKRPKDGYAAALIDRCGLKGFSVGGAAVSTKHAGFVLNMGGATCRDVLALMDEIKKKVLAETGTELEPEVEVL